MFSSLEHLSSDLLLVSSPLSCRFGSRNSAFTLFRFTQESEFYCSAESFPEDNFLRSRTFFFSLPAASFLPERRRTELFLLHLFLRIHPRPGPPPRLTLTRDARALTVGRVGWSRAWPASFHVWRTKFPHGQTRVRPPAALLLLFSSSSSSSSLLLRIAFFCQTAEHS